MAYVAGRVELPALEMKTIRRGDLDLRLVFSRIHRHLRILDFRVGSYLEKRDLLDQLARQENLRKIFTIVEKSDSQSWRAVGFSKEGIIPGFFRTADSYLMTRVYENGEPVLGGAPKPPGDRFSGPKKRIRRPDGATVEVIRDPIRLSQAGVGSITDYRIAPLGGTALDPEVAARVKLRRDVFWVTGEVDESFGHARVDLCSPRRGPTETAAVAFGLQTLMADLEPRGVTSIFGLCALTDAWAIEVYTSLGFKVTGRLADHVVAPDGQFQHAAIFHQRTGGGGGGEA